LEHRWSQHSKQKHDGWTLHKVIIFAAATIVVAAVKSMNLSLPHLEEGIFLLKKPRVDAEAGCHAGSQAMT
jgi:hypothetical protein